MILDEYLHQLLARPAKETLVGRKFKAILKEIKGRRELIGLVARDHQKIREAIARHVRSSSECLYFRALTTQNQELAIKELYEIVTGRAPSSKWRPYDTVRKLELVLMRRRQKPEIIIDGVSSLRFCALGMLLTHFAYLSKYTSSMIFIFDERGAQRIRSQGGVYYNLKEACQKFERWYYL